MNKRTIFLWAGSLLVASQCFAAVLNVYTSIAAADPYWRNVKTDGNVTDGGFTIVRELPDLDNRYSDDLEALYRAVTLFTNVVVDANTYTGTFANSSVEVVQGELRSSTIRNTIVKLASLSGTNSSTMAASLALQPYTITEDNEILDLFGIQTGEGDKRAFIFKYLNPSEKTSCMVTIEDADLVSNLSSGWTYYTRKWKEEDDGSASFVVMFEKVAWRAWSTNLVNDVIEYSNAGTSNPRESMRRTWLSIRNTNTLQVAADLRSSAMAPSGYTITAIDIVLRADGAINAVQTCRVQGSNIVIQSSELINPNSLCEGSVSRTTTTYSGYASTNDVPNPTNKVVGVDAGVIANGITGPDGDGLFGRTIVEEVVSWDAWSNQTSETWNYIQYRTPDRDGTEITKVWCGIQKEDATNAVDDLYSTNFTDSGYVVTVAGFTDSRDGSVLLTQVQTEINLLSAATTWSMTPFSTDTTKTDRNMLTAIAHGTNQTQGYVVSTRDTLTADGLHDHTYSTNAATLNVTSRTDRAVTTLSDASSVVVRNQTNAVQVVTVVTNGTIVSTGATLNETLTWDNSTQTETAIPNVTVQTSYADGVMSGSSSVTVDNQTNGVTDGVSVSNGVITEKRGALNRFGRYTVTTSEETAVPDVEASTNRTLGVMSDSYSSTTVNQTNALTNATEVANGVVTSHRSELNRYGMYDNTISLNVANQNVTNSQSFTKSKFRESESITIANQTNKISSGTAVTNGIITTVKDDLNAFGLHDHTTSTDTAVEAVAVRISQTITPFDTTVVTNSINLTNSTDFATNQIAGRIVSQTRETNEHGLTDESISVKSGTTNIPSRYASSRGVLSRQYSVTIDNQTEEVTNSSAVSNGVITEVGSSLNQYGWWDVTLSTNTANQDVTNRIARSQDAMSQTSSETVANQTNSVEAYTYTSNGVLTRTRSDLNAHGLWDVTTDTETATTNITVQTSYSDGVLSDSSSVVIDNQVDGVTDGVAVSNGVITVKRGALNKFGLYTVTTSEEAAKTNVVTQQSYSDGIMANNASVTISNVEEPVTNGTAVADGKIIDTRSVRNQFDLFDITTSTNTANQNVTNRITVAKDAFSESTAQTIANKTNAVETSTYATNGVQTRVTSDLNSHGWWDVTTSTETSISNALASTNMAQTVFETRIGETRRGVAAPIASSVDTNVIVTVNNTVQPDGWYAISRDTRQFSPVTNASITYIATAFGMTTNTRSINVLTIPEIPTGTVGVVRSLTVTKTDAKAYDIEERSSVVNTDVLSGNDVAKDEFNTVTTIKSIGKTAQATNEWETDRDFTLDVANVLDETGLWNTTVRTNTFNAVTNAQTTTTADAFSSQTRTVSRHADNDLAAVSTVTDDNEIVIHTSQKDPTGKWDNTATTNTPIAQLYTNVVSLSEFGGVTTIRAHNAKNMASPESTSETNTVSSVSGSMNQFGLYDYTKQTQWHSLASGTNGISGGSFTWSEQSQPTYKIAVYAGDVISSVGEYYREYIHTVTLHDTQAAAWEDRDTEGHDPVKTHMSVGQFAPGIWYYHTAYRGTNDEVVVYP